MRKALGMSVLVLLISCAAAWGTQQVRMFQRLPMAFSSLAFAANDAQEFHAPTSPNGEAGERPQRHGTASPLENWKNVLAYFSIFAFVVMLTHYSEDGLRKFAHRRELNMSASGDATPLYRL